MYVTKTKKARKKYLLSTFCVLIILYKLYEPKLKVLINNRLLGFLKNMIHIELLINLLPKSVNQI